MDFKENKAIYLQIADRICEEILTGVFREEERVPSVREYAVKVEVNVNTVMRSYDKLQGDGVIYNRRGIGYFVAGGAVLRIKEMKKQTFMKEDMPVFFRQASLLGMTAEELQGEYENYLKNEEQ
ncbi:MAG TPA: GntR family transcriptional regulator [Candidatus Avibacteroides excrementipullorum]|jgi:DNA-binding transcriptional regulator YhcF (GntR family)|nr:GntR family transcriptional regulator [Candidatus Avibacteroides excrementipullorum]